MDKDVLKGNIYLGIGFILLLITLIRQEHNVSYYLIGACGFLMVLNGGRHLDKATKRGVQKSPLSGVTMPKFNFEFFKPNKLKLLMVLALTSTHIIVKYASTKEIPYLLGIFLFVIGYYALSIFIIHWDNSKNFDKKYYLSLLYVCAGVTIAILLREDLLE